MIVSACWLVRLRFPAPKLRGPLSWLKIPVLRALVETTKFWPEGSSLR